MEEKGTAVPSNNVDYKSFLAALSDVQNHKLKAKLQNNNAALKGFLFFKFN